jgi:hypothetical protein
VCGERGMRGQERRMLEFSQTTEWSNSPMSQKCMFNIILSSLHVGFSLRFSRQGVGSAGVGAEIGSQRGWFSSL